MTMTWTEIMSWAGWISLWLMYPLLWVSGYLKGKTEGLREAREQYRSDAERMIRARKDGFVELTDEQRRKLFGEGDRDA